MPALSWLKGLPARTASEILGDKSVPGFVRPPLQDAELRRLWLEAAGSSAVRRPANWTAVRDRARAVLFGYLESKGYDTRAATWVVRSGPKRASGRRGPTARHRDKLQRTKHGARVATVTQAAGAEVWASAGDGTEACHAQSAALVQVDSGAARRLGVAWTADAPVAHLQASMPRGPATAALSAPASYRDCLPSGPAPPLAIEAVPLPPAQQRTTALTGAVMTIAGVTAALTPAAGLVSLPRSSDADGLRVVLGEDDLQEHATEADWLSSSDDSY